MNFNGLIAASCCLRFLLASAVFSGENALEIFTGKSTITILFYCAIIMTDRYSPKVRSQNTENIDTNMVGVKCQASDWSFSQAEIIHDNLKFFIASSDRVRHIPDALIRKEI